MKRKQQLNVAHRVVIGGLVHHTILVNVRDLVHVTRCEIVVYPRRKPETQIKRMTGYAYDMTPTQIAQGLMYSVASPDPGARVGELETKLKTPVTRAHSTATITCMSCAARSEP